MLNNHVKLMQFFSQIQTVPGRKKLQKIIYILQVCGIGFEEKFAFHKFGPYSEELTLRVEELCNLGLIQEQQINKQHYTQYHYTITSEGTAFLQQFGAKTNDLYPQVDLLQHESARFLELVATMLYFRELSPSEVESKIQIVKPKQHYTQAELQEAWDFIAKMNGSSLIREHLFFSESDE